MAVSKASLKEGWAGRPQVSRGATISTPGRQGKKKDPEQRRLEIQRKNPASALAGCMNWLPGRDSNRIRQTPENYQELRFQKKHFSKNTPVCTLFMQALGGAFLSAGR
jgi:hypothetical protein